MKKNKMMRLASVMMVMTLMTTSVISGTFAKYVTSDSAKDTARVAKFGVVVTASGKLFDETYKATSDNGPGGLAFGADASDMTVVSEGHLVSGDPDNVVAPGTKNADGLIFTISGKPEVDVAVDVEVTQANSTAELTDANNIFLKANTYEDMTTGADDDYKLTADYYPVKYTLTQTIGGTDNVLVSEGNLEAISDALENLTTTYDALTDLSEKVGTLKLTWEWAFDDNDKADTILGDIAATIVNTDDAGNTLTSGTDYNLNTGLTVTVKVTQID